MTKIINNGRGIFRYDDTTGLFNGGDLPAIEFIFGHDNLCINGAPHVDLKVTNEEVICTRCDTHFDCTKTHFMTRSERNAAYTRIWMVQGKAHRVGNDAAVEFPNGSYMYYKNGLLSSTCGPALKITCAELAGKTIKGILTCGDCHRGNILHAIDGKIVDKSRNMFMGLNWYFDDGVTMIDIRVVSDEIDKLYNYLHQPKFSPLQLISNAKYEKPLETDFDSIKITDAHVDGKPVDMCVSNFDTIKVCL